MYTVGQFSSIFYFFLIFISFPILNLFLAVELRQKWNVVWWQDFGFFISELIKPWIYLAYLVEAFFRSF
jgi:hypothetical protein